VTTADRDRIATLTKRALHLENRILRSPKNLTYDKEEMDALKWAIKILTSVQPLVVGGEKET